MSAAGKSGSVFLTRSRSGWIAATVSPAVPQIHDVDPRARSHDEAGPEEHVLRSDQEIDEVSDPTVNIINDGRCVPDGDILTSRHGKKGEVGWADSHVSTVTWKFARDPINSRPDL